MWYDVVFMVTSGCFGPVLYQIEYMVGSLRTE